MYKVKHIPIDWQACCLQLRKHKPLTQIALMIGCDDQVINRLARGEIAEPRFSIGLELLNLYTDLIGDTQRLWNER
jgi:hypothetical protein